MSYIGKDIVHYGCGLELDPEIALSKIAHSARKNIRKGEDAGIRIERHDASEAMLSALRKLWYFPDDPNFPSELDADGILFVAYLADELIGGMILIPVGSHLFLNNLISNETGKKHQLQGLLLWRAVQELKDSQYRYIDVGVSYRPNLYRFFKKWSTFHYPVIFNPPRIKPTIRFAPFMELPDLSGVSVDEMKIGRFCADRPYTIVPDISYAEQIAKDRDVKYRRVMLPQADSPYPLELVDLPQWLPLQYGALIVGCEIAPKELWDRYGCYDEFKTDHIKRMLCSEAADPAAILSARRRLHEQYVDCFTGEDVGLLPSADGYPAFKITADEAEALEARYATFDIEVCRDGRELAFPCHQNLGVKDVEYVYAVYRGYLNLCSEWIPTNVKGKLKVQESSSN